MTKLEKQIYNTIKLEFCKALRLSSQKVTDSMNASPCFLGSEKHFENTVKSVLKAINRNQGA